MATEKNGFRFRVSGNRPPSSYVGIYDLGEYQLGFAEGSRGYPYVNEKSVIEIYQQKGVLIWANIYFLGPGATKLGKANLSGSIDNGGVVNLYGSVNSVRGSPNNNNVFQFRLRNTGDNTYEVSYGNSGPGSSFNSSAKKLSLGTNIIKLFED